MTASSEIRQEQGGPSRPWRREGLLLDAGTSVDSAPSLVKLCQSQLSDLLFTVASWEPSQFGKAWLVSDSTLIVVAFTSAPDSEAYVQFLSEPTESTVLFEVSSVQYQPGLEVLMNTEREQALRERGFTLGPPRSSYRSDLTLRPARANYRREVSIAAASHAWRVAEEALHILFEIFHFRGRAPLTYLLVGERIALTETAHTRLTAKQLTFLLRQWGFRPDLAPRLN